MKPKLISIVGPTGIGKTSLSIQLAQHYHCDIISSDSRQFYKEMSIGTAAPTAEELSAANHHFIQHKSVTETYNVGDFEKDAIKKINELHTSHPNLIMVGGSGLYVKAVTHGLDYFPEVDSLIREQLNSKLVAEGLIHLQRQLKVLDPKGYQNIAIDNPHRVIRALEICIGTGTPYSSFLSKTKKKRNFRSVMIGLSAERPILYGKINTRVDQMFKNGLLEEVKHLIPYKKLNALNTVAYKELFQYLEGQISLDFAQKEIKKNSRRYAKRQLTWFKKNTDIQWFDFKTPISDIISHIDKIN